MNFNEKTVGINIRKYRLYNELNQHWLAKQVGISRKTLIAYEKGYSTVPPHLYNCFAQALSTTAERLLGNINTTPPPPIKLINPIQKFYPSTSTSLLLLQKAMLAGISTLMFPNVALLH